MGLFRIAASPVFTTCHLLFLLPYISRPREALIYTYIYIGATAAYVGVLLIYHTTFSPRPYGHLGITSITPRTISTY